MAPVEYGQTLPKSTRYRAGFTGCSGRLHGLFWPGRHVPGRWDSGTEAIVHLPGGQGSAVEAAARDQLGLTLRNRHSQEQGLGVTPEGTMSGPAAWVSESGSGRAARRTAGSAPR
jgi:hypothetical protein